MNAVFPGKQKPHKIYACDWTGKITQCIIEDEKKESGLVKIFFSQEYLDQNINRKSYNTDEFREELRKLLNTAFMGKLKRERERERERERKRERENTVFLYEDSWHQVYNKVWMIYASSINDLFNVLQRHWVIWSGNHAKYWLNVQGLH